MFLLGRLRELKVIKNFLLRKIPEILKVQERMREYISGESCYYLQVIYHEVKIFELVKSQNEQ